MKKRILALLLAAIMVAALLASCSDSNDAQQNGSDNTDSDTAQSGAATGDENSDETSDDTSDETSGETLLDKIKEKGEITIAMEGTWSPWTYYDENDVLMGYDVEVGQAIADYLGVEANFVTGEWNGLLGGLESGLYDIMINGMDVTEERKETYNFSEPYAYSYTVLITTGDNDTIKSFEDLDGLTTANSIGSTYMDMGEEYGAEVLGVDTLDETLALVLSGRADATINAELSFQDYMKVHPDANLKIVCRADNPNAVAIPVRKSADCDSLLTEINAALDEMRESGKLSELSIKYFGTDITE